MVVLRCRFVFHLFSQRTFTDGIPPFLCASLIMSRTSAVLLKGKSPKTALSRVSHVLVGAARFWAFSGLPSALLGKAQAILLALRFFLELLNPESRRDFSAGNLRRSAAGCTAFNPPFHRCSCVVPSVAVAILLQSMFLQYSSGLN